MGTISEKLVYLDETREKIKENLNKFGSNITDNDTFRSYSNVINDIYDKLPKVSANGSNFSLENAQNGKLDSFGMDGNTEQTTYTGKNLLNTSNEYPTGYSTTINGITFTINNDKTITANGTATGENARFTFIENGTILGTNKKITAQLISGTISGQCTFFAYESTYENAKTSQVATDGSVNNTTLATNVEYAKFRLTVYAGATVNNAKFGLMVINSDETNTTYEPYVGGTPSPNPDYPQDIRVVNGTQNVKVVGKNILNITDAYSNSTGLEKSYVNGVASLTWNAGFAFYMEQNESHNLPLKMFDSSKTYTISFKHKGNSLYLRFDETTNNILATETDSDYTDYSYTFTGLSQLVIKFVRKENSGTAYLKDFQIEINNQATTYEPYQNQDYEIDLDDIELCKIGDYKDVIFKNNQLSSYYDSTLDEDSWYIKKEIGKVVLDGSESDWEKPTGSTIQINSYRIPNYISANRTDTSNPYLSNYFTTIKTSQRYIDKTFFINVNSAIIFSYDDITTLEQFKTWLSTHNTTVYYALVTPTYETITNETLISQLESIETFTGVNNFSVSNDNNVLPTLYVSRLKELGKLG